MSVEVNLAILYLYLQFLDKQQEDIEDDMDYRALESGYVSRSIVIILNCFKQLSQLTLKRKCNVHDQSLKEINWEMHVADYLLGPWKNKYFGIV